MGRKDGKEGRGYDTCVSNRKNLCKVLEVEVSSSQRTPVLAAGFQLKGNLCHFDKLHNILQLEISHVPLEIKRAKHATLFLAGTSVVLVNAV